MLNKLSFVKLNKFRSIVKIRWTCYYHGIISNYLLGVFVIYTWHCTFLYIPTCTLIFKIMNRVILFVLKPIVIYLTKDRRVLCVLVKVRVVNIETVMVEKICRLGFKRLLIDSSHCFV